MQIKRPLFPIALGATLTALVVVYLGPAVPAWAPALLVLPALSFLGRYLFRPDSIRKGLAGLGWLTLGAVTVLCAFRVQALHIAKAQDAFRTGGCYVRVVDFPENEFGKTVLTVRPETEAGVLPVRMQVTVYEEMADVIPGARLYLTADVYPVSGDSDAGRRKLGKGIALQGYAEQAPILRSQGKLTLATLPAFGRKLVTERIKGAFGPESSLILALILGDRSGFSETFYDQTADAGISHIFSVSGMHLSVLVGAVMMLGKRYRRAGSLVAMAVALAFTALTDFNAPVVRSMILQYAVLGAVFFGREADTWSSLGFALVILLVCNPFMIADLSAQLSFLSVAGLLLFAAPLESALVRRTPGLSRFRLWRWTVRSISVTCAAQAFTVPLVSAYFHRISLIAPISNLLILWLVNLLFLSGMAVLVILLIWPTLGILAAYPLRYVCKALSAAIACLAQVPFSTVGTASVAAKAAITGVYGVLVFLYLRRPKRPFLIGLAGVTVIVSLAIGFNAWQNRTTMWVSVVDVGYGQLTIVRQGNTAVAVDCGNRAGSAPGMVEDYLKSNNLSTLDALILTSSASHHANGTAEVFRRGLAEMLVLSPYGGMEQQQQRVKAAGKAGAKIVEVTGHKSLTVGTLRVELWMPGDTRAEQGYLGVRITGKQGSVVVLGDLPVKLQQKLWVNQKLRPCDVLVSAGHGQSKYHDSTVYNTLSPEYTVINTAFLTKKGMVSDLPGLWDLEEKGSFSVGLRGK